MGYKPGDLLENSGGVREDLKPVVEDLEKVRPVTLRRVRDLIAVADAIASDASAETRSVVAPTGASAANVVHMPERTMPQWTPEFPVEPANFNDNGDTDFPLIMHAWEVEDLDDVFGAAGGQIGSPGNEMTKLLHNSKAVEVKDTKVRTIRVRGDSMAPVFQHGWKLAVDVTRHDPHIGDPLLVYKKDQGTVIGYYDKVGDRGRLLKANPAHDPVWISGDDQIVGVIDYVAWQPVPRHTIGVEDATDRRRKNGK